MPRAKAQLLWGRTGPLSALEAPVGTQEKGQHQSTIQEPATKSGKVSNTRPLPALEDDAMHGANHASAKSQARGPVCGVLGSELSGWESGRVL